MKQIIPFKKELLFKTKVSEVTSISLEHNFKINDDVISGNFCISGDYKMTEGSINREKFSFDLPFDIALDSRYKEDSMLVDIDNFYYQIINNEALQIHIDLYVDGEKIVEEVKEVNEPIKFEDLVERIDETEENRNNLMDFEEKIVENINFAKGEKKDDLLDHEIVSEVEMEKNINMNQNVNVNKNLDNNKKSDFNIFDNNDDSETYRAYYVYIVKENDNIDKILDKYQITKEEIGLYNGVENIKPGDKIIIPSKNE